MPHTLSGVSICIWDFDGTLYKQLPALWDMIRASEIRTIIDHTGWSEEKAKEEFYKIYNVTTPSGTKTVSLLTGISSEQASLETAAYTDYTGFLRPDPKLTALFDNLSGFRHFMLVNGTQASVIRGLALLGLDQKYFEEVVTSELVGETKPSVKGFLYIMKKTGLPASAHLMVGDREQVDLVPAKSLGLRTALVWAEEQSKIADVTLSSVYDIASVLL